jgi:hypothetical protein
MLPDGRMLSRDRSNAMKLSNGMSFAAIVFALGTAAPALANGFYTGIDPHNPPGTQNRVLYGQPYYVEPAPGPVYVEPVEPQVYVDPMPTGSIYVDPYVDPAPGYVYRPPARTLGDARQRYTGEYQSGGQGDYYLGVAHPPQVP